MPKCLSINNLKLKTMKTILSILISFGLVLFLTQPCLHAQDSWKTFRDAEIQFRFLHPPEWLLTQPRGPNVKATLTPPPGKPRANCNIVVGKFMDLENVSQNQINALFSEIEFSDLGYEKEMQKKWPDYRITESKKVKVDNQPAFYFVCESSNETVDRKTFIKGITLFTFTTGLVWTFNCAGKGDTLAEANESFKYWKPTFDRIIGSLVFENKFNQDN